MFQTLFGTVSFLLIRIDYLLAYHANFYANLINY
jgi:hypothetical protein